MKNFKARQSTIALFDQCPKRFKFRFIDNIRSLLGPEANNALIVGSTLHYGAEHDKDKMIDFYEKQFRSFSTDNEVEIIKLEYAYDSMIQVLKTLDIYKKEFTLSTNDFTGTIDVITKTKNGYGLYDIKYSTNYDYYINSPQLHIYKYYMEKIYNMKITEMGYIFVTKIKEPKYFKNLDEGRKILEGNTIFKNVLTEIKNVKYNESFVDKFHYTYNHIKNVIMLYELNKDEGLFEKNETFFCNWCPYKKLCLGGGDELMYELPKNIKKKVEVLEKPNLMIYGASYCGKSVFADSYPDVLFFNTDGNTQHLTSPVVNIQDTVEKEGRLIKREFAWNHFKEYVTTLCEEKSTYEVMVFDLVEDLYRHCRNFMFDKLKIEHESDDKFSAWDKVTFEFIREMKKLKSSGYRLFFILREKETNVYLRGGTITKYEPDVRSIIARALSGMVDATIRFVADGSDRYIFVGNDPYVFSGGRMTFDVDRVEMDRESFESAVSRASVGSLFTDNSPTERKSKSTSKVKKAVKDEVTALKDATIEAIEKLEENAQKLAEPIKKTRKSRTKRAVDVFKEDKYYYFQQTKSYICIKKGSLIPTSEEYKLYDEITKEEYLENTKLKAKKNTYYHHKKDNEFLMLEKGAYIPDSKEFKECIEITEEEYNHGLNSEKISPTEEVKTTTRKRRKRRVVEEVPIAEDEALAIDNMFRK